jgi:hypothetical protein
VTTAQAAKLVGLAPSTMLARVRRAGIDMTMRETGKRGRPGYQWTAKLARAIARMKT